MARKNSKVSDFGAAYLSLGRVKMTPQPVSVIRQAPKPTEAPVFHYVPMAPNAPSSGANFDAMAHPAIVNAANHAAAMVQGSGISSMGPVGPLSGGPATAVSSGGGGGGSAGGAIAPSAGGGFTTDFSPPPEMTAALPADADAGAIPTGPLSTAMSLVAPRSTALATTGPALSIWQRIVNWFKGLFSSKSAATMSADPNMPTNMKDMAESVVRRARNRDQNAMALISLVRENAARGYRQAQLAKAHIELYIAKNPVSATMHGETEEVGDCYPDAVAMSFKAQLFNPRIELLSQAFAQDSLRLRRILHEARRIQAVRKPNSSLSQFDRRVACELGEI